MGRKQPLKDRLLEKVEVTDDGCWRFTGALRPSGYGVIGAGYGGAVLSAHRASYEVHVAPIPDGLHIDHLCNNRACVNPEHLEPVTQAENNRRAVIVRVQNATACKRDHEFTPENTLWHKGRRRCRECARLLSMAQRRGLTVDSLVALLIAGVK